ncbi:hypothetical protein CONCODRAFT_157920 [Conidiobolus coronatus NRRL 28638]|uniref:Uncharacterized protein n=1 Tax=Conidiobolus coronatus (strain ATCC 28846 / CBS 209.66 / NRRL 28638) TaxID=796925 RepID=A0A137P6Z8_CONC2|nr:hypothetical protein CONCODRAFT_157920 [Conidiobolus coronatus NRRL 28638]|eukprot:KXN70714.1 hypothetical protein CONCODRAFT_157920 [Conidiobolus coronatus NRRL 28638]
MGNSQSNSSHYSQNSSSEDNNIVPNSTPAYLDPNSLSHGTTNSSPNLNQHAQPKNVGGKGSSSGSNRRVQIHKNKNSQNGGGYGQYSNSPFVGSPLIHDEFGHGGNDNLNPHFPQASYLTNRRNLSQPDTFPSSLPSALSPLTKAQDLALTPEGSVPNQSGLGTLQLPAVEIEQDYIASKFLFNNLTYC